MSMCIACVEAEREGAVAEENCGTCELPVCEGHRGGDAFLERLLFGRQLSDANEVICNNCGRLRLVNGWRGLVSVISVLLAIVACSQGQWLGLLVSAAVWGVWWAVTAPSVKACHRVHEHRVQLAKSSGEPSEK